MRYDKGDKPGYWLPFLKYVYDPQLTAEQNLSALKTAIDACNSGLNKNIRMALDIVGISKHITTHCARHGFARYARKKKKKELDVIMNMMGHSSIAQTMVYTGEHAPEELDNEARGLFD
jgi:integrase